MRSPVTSSPDQVSSTPCSDSAHVLDELHTVSALLSATLAVAEPGAPVERCLTVSCEVLKEAIRKLSLAT